MGSPGPVCRSLVVKEKLFGRVAFEPSEADLNFIGEHDDDVVMVDFHNKPLKKSKGKVADSDDEPISNLKGKGKVKAKKVPESKSRSRHRVDDVDDDDIESDFESNEDDDMSDFVVESDKEKDARLALKRRLWKSKAAIMLDSDEEMNTPEE